MKLHLVLFFAIVGVTTRLVNGEDCKGCVSLDALSFDKVISKFKASLVKFDVAFPYGEKHEEFGKVAGTTKDAQDLLVATVGIKDFGNKDNSDLAERFNIDKADFPVILLFIHGQTEPHKLLTGASNDFSADNIKRLVKARTSIYLGLPGCIEKLDRLAEEFKKTSGDKERREILKKAKVFEETLSEEEQIAAKVYVKMMEKIMERGDVFVQTEESRIHGLLKGKLSNEKKRSMEERRNILQSFAYRDEL